MRSNAIGANARRTILYVRSKNSQNRIQARTHSLRFGSQNLHATLVKKGRSDSPSLGRRNRHDIKRQGLWKSEAVSHYIQDNTLTHSSAINAFANSVNQGASTSKAAQAAEEDKQARRHQHTKKQDKENKRQQRYKKGPNSKNKRIKFTRRE